MHPTSEVVEVLTVAVPFAARIRRLVRALLGKLLSDAQATPGRMRLRRLSEPSPARVAFAMASERLVDAMDETYREPLIAILGSFAREREEVADREGVRPQVAGFRPCRVGRIDPGAFEESGRQLDGRKQGIGHWIRQIRRIQFLVPGEWSIGPSCGRRPLPRTACVTF